MAQPIDLTSRLEQSFSAASKKPFLKRRGSFVSTTLLLGIGPDEYLVRIENGAIREVKHGPLLTPSVDFSVRASEDTWNAFWAARPAPGMNDILGLLKKGLMKFEGNLHPLMSNLFFFKEVLAGPRHQRSEHNV
jgi:hypothetical protein